MTRVTLKYLKRLPNGKFQYRRAWPEDVRSARPDLPRERKKTFTSPDGSEREAIKIAQDLDREFETVKRQVRSGLATSAATWKTQENVRRWYTANKSEFDAVIAETPTTTPDGLPVIETTTAAEIIVENMLRDAARREGYGLDGHPKRLTLEEELKIEALLSGGVPEPKLTIKDAYDIYLEKHLDGNEDKASRTAIDQFLEFMGTDCTPIADVTRQIVREWTEWLVRVRGQASATVQRRVGAMKAIVNFSRDLELFDGKNPFERMKLPKAAKPPKEILPFHHTHLAAIEQHLSESRRVHAETRHLLSMLKLTGCRPSEIGGLRAEDLQLDADIPYAIVRWTDMRRLKNPHSQRRVPLIGAALQGATELAALRRSGWLFPSLAPTKGDRNDNQALSQRVNKLIRGAGIPRTEQLVAYSFRHTMIEALDQVPALSFKVRQRTVGRGKTDQYGAKEQPLQITLDAMNAAIPLLGRVDEVMYEPWMLHIGERPKST